MVCITVAVKLASAHRYGHHRDELYFIAIGQHPQWGYVDQPALVPRLAAAMDRLGNGSLTVLRLPSALAAGGVVWLTAKMAQDLGGNARAQVLAAAAATASSFRIAVGHLVSTSTYDLLWWTLLSWLLVRALRDGGHVWLWVGLVAGVALHTKPLVLLFLGAVLVSLIGHQALRSMWPWLAGALALAIWMPNLVWQVQNGLPVVEMRQSVAGGSSATSEPRALVVPFQLVLAVPIWTLGLWHLGRSPALKPWRRLALAYVITLVLVLVVGGKPYYTAGFLPLLLAAAAVWTYGHHPGTRRVVISTTAAVWTYGHHPGTRRVVISTTAAFAVVGVLLFLPLLPVRWLHLTPVPAVDADAAETVGWPRFASTVGTVADDSGADVAVGDNYGEAGAMLRFSPDLDTVSPHNSLWDLGGPPAGPDLAVMVGFEESADWTAVWPTLRHLN